MFLGAILEIEYVCVFRQLVYCPTAVWLALWQSKLVESVLGKLSSIQLQKSANRIEARSLYFPIESGVQAHIENGFKLTQMPC